MKIICYSDLHLEFVTNFNLPDVCEADILILAGDIITFTDYSPLLKLLRNWKKPVLYVAGNHEYYTHWKVLNDNNSKGFVGYDFLEAKTSVLRYRKVKGKGRELYQIVLDETPSMQKVVDR